MTAKLLTTFKQQIRGLTLVPKGGGCFELSVDGELIYSKLQTGKFPDEKWVLDALAARFAGSKAQSTKDKVQSTK